MISRIVNFKNVLPRTYGTRAFGTFSARLSATGYGELDSENPKKLQTSVFYERLEKERESKHDDAVPKYVTHEHDEYDHAMDEFLCGDEQLLARRGPTKASDSSQPTSADN
ncbi:hypothetical protein K7432_003566 [Basidiobolus ranarum]|uniref:Uncharacterized protein n=1 Tax=Basidiobolus ranarum TaxID=34480 RepID=A0ABR2W614_9FUNG